MAMKEYLLGIFPALKNEWKVDHGRTVLEEYFAVQKRQLELETLWNKMTGWRLETMNLTAEDVLLMQIRLMPCASDPRPEFTRDEIRWLTELYNSLVGQQNPAVPYDDYEKFMHLVLTRKADDTRNSLLMKRRFLMAQLVQTELGGSGQQFEVQIETGEVLIAELICGLEMDGVDYALYTLPNEHGTFDIMASIVQQDAQGYDTLVDIQDPAINEKIRTFLVKNYLSDVDEGSTLAQLLGADREDEKERSN